MPETSTKALPILCPPTNIKLIEDTSNAYLKGNAEYPKRLTMHIIWYPGAVMTLDGLTVAYTAAPRPHHDHVTVT